MNYEAALLQNHCRSTIDRIARTVGNSPAELKKIIAIVYHGEEPLPQRASWVLAVVNKKHPELLLPYLKKFADTIDTFGNNAVRRNMLTVFAAHNIPESLEAILIDKCFYFVKDHHQPIAVKALSLEILGNLAIKHPGMYNELRAVIDAQQHTATPAFKVKARRILERIS